jgi:hypothetical protein
MRKSSTPRTDGAFNPEEQAAFLGGATVACRSSTVQNATWSEQDGTLTLVLEGGDRQRLEGVDAEMALAFAQAPSKGEFIASKLPGDKRPEPPREADLPRDASTPQSGAHGGRGRPNAEDPAGPRRPGPLPPR